jgi:lipocalin
MRSERERLITAIEFLRDNRDSGIVVEYIATKYSARLNPDKTVAENADSLVSFILQYTSDIAERNIANESPRNSQGSMTRPIKLLLKADFNLKRYMGLWYSAGSIPQPFDQGTAWKDAVYELSTQVDEMSRPLVIVTNTGYNEDGSIRGQILGAAVTVNPDQPAALCVRFPTGRPDRCETANYLVHDTNYQDYAIVGSYDGSNLYILVRRRPIFRREYERYVRYAASLGYDVSRLIEDYGGVQA